METQDSTSPRALKHDLQSKFSSKCESVKILIIEESEAAMFNDATSHFCRGPLHADLAVSSEESDLAGRALAVGLSTASVSHANEGRRSCIARGRK